VKDLSNKKIFFILIFLVAIFFYIEFVYAACPGNWYCDNTPEGATRECGEVGPGTYNGSFAGKEAHHYWNTTKEGPYVNVTVSIDGENDGYDDLDLYVEDPTGTEYSSTSSSPDETISICSVAGMYRSDVYSYSISADACAPYDIIISAVSQDCCEDDDCDDLQTCSQDTCLIGGCNHCTREGENATTCGLGFPGGPYPCCSGLGQCYDGICRAECPDFIISLNPTSLTILIPNSDTSVVNITSINDFNYPVSLSGNWIGAVPSGVSFSYDPSPVIPPIDSSNYSDLTITVSSAANSGTYTLRTNATSGFLTHTADLTVDIVEIPFNFDVSVSPSSGTVVQGDWITTNVNVPLLSGSAEWVSLGVSGCPPDATCTFNPGGGNPTYISTLNISTSYSTPNGTYTITVTGTGGGLTRSDTYILTVDPYPGCVRADPVVNIIPIPPGPTGRAGQTLTYTVTVTNKDSTNCPPSTFSLEATVPPSFSYSFTQSTLTIKPVGFTNTDSTDFYVKSDCTSSEGSHTITVNATNTDAPSYFGTGSTIYRVSDHFRTWLSPETNEGVSGSTSSYRVYIYNNKHSSCGPTTFSHIGIVPPVPPGWSYTLDPQLVVSPLNTLFSWFIVSSPCEASPGDTFIGVNSTDISTGITKTAGGIYNIYWPYCSIRSIPFFDFGPFSSTLTATFYNLNTTCFSTATLNCGQGDPLVTSTISGDQVSTSCSYLRVDKTTYYTARANVSANIPVECQTTVVDNPYIFNFSVSVTPEPDYDGLAGFWPFDEGWGISTADKSGNNNDGNLGVTHWEYVPGWTLGKFGHGLEFDGSDDYVRINNVPVNTSSGAYNTVTFWMYWNGNGIQMPLGWSTAYDLFLYSGCFGFNTRESNVLGVPWDGLANSWHHVAAIFYNGVPSTTTVSLYIDGIEQSIYECVGSTTASRTVTPTFHISGWAYGTDYYFDGTIDEVKIFNKSLTDEEILREYQLSKVVQGENISALVPVTLLSGNTQPVSLSLSMLPPEPSISLSLDQTTGDPTYTSILNISTSPLTPIGNYTINITGTNGTITRSMNYTIEVLLSCTRANPLLEISPVSKSGIAGSELSYSIYLKNNDGLGCPANTYTLNFDPDFDFTGWSYEFEADVIFSDGFESGDFSTWDLTDVSKNETTGIEDTAEVITTDPYHGNYHANFTDDGSDYSEHAFAQKMFTAQSEIYEGSYIKFKSGLPQYDNRFIAFMRLYAGGSGMVLEARVSKSTDIWQLYYFKDGSYVTLDYTSGPSLDTWYNVEVYIKIHGTQGEVGMYVNGAEILSDSGFDNNDYGNVDVSRVGLVYSSCYLNTVQSLYVDSVIISSSSWSRVVKTLNPQEEKIINLNVTSSSGAGTETYSFDIIASSGSYSNTTTGNYIVTEVCDLTQCETGSDPPCIDHGTCWGDQICDNGNLIPHCGDGICNCGENDETCSVDCVTVYFKLFRGWNLISLHYKNVAEVTGDQCGESNLYFYFWKNKTWEKVLGIKNIEGGYGYWVNPEWFTKTGDCSINVTVNKEEGMTIQDLPELKKGYNAIGTINETKKINLFKNCSMPIKLYWDALNKEWKTVGSSPSDSFIPTKGYWIYVENETCKLSL